MACHIGVSGEAPGANGRDRSAGGADCDDRDAEAIDRGLESFGNSGDLEGRTARQARIILFYHGELREFLAGELARAPERMSTRELAEALCQTEGRGDRRMINDVTKRLSKAPRVETRHRIQ